jgi:hypothetical protein
MGDGYPIPYVPPSTRRQNCHEVSRRAPVSWSRTVSPATAAAPARRPLRHGRVMPIRSSGTCRADLASRPYCCRRGTHQDGLADARHALDEHRAFRAVG